MMQISSGCFVFVASTVVADIVNVFSESANAFFFFFFMFDFKCKAQSCDSSPGFVVGTVFWSVVSS